MVDQTIARLLDLSGQVALITGASKGIGRAMAELFARAGAKVGLIARSANLLEEVAGHLRRDLNIPEDAVLVLPADIANEDQVSQVAQQAVQAWERIDILINNAGLISFGAFDQIDLPEWERVIGANLTGAYLCSRAVAPIMKQQRSGRIINISSVSAQTGGVSGGAHYAASKGGMLAMTKTFARDLASFGITVNAIAPGQIDADPNLLTPEARARVTSMIPLGRLGDPKEIAYAALFLASPMGAYITGATLDVNGGILKR
jgi:NAD(P)-dependent dehydrogenase (short-subunit alcohol dehydrogenase family)